MEEHQRIAHGCLESQKILFSIGNMASDDPSFLTPEQEQLVVQLQEITANQNRDYCVELLRSNHWNIEVVAKLAIMLPPH